MELRAGYKKSEVGLIPSDWDIKTYGEIFDFLTTATYSRAELTENDIIKYVHYGDIHTKWNFFLDFSNCNLPTIRDEQVKNYHLLHDGDLIMADASEDYSGIGKCIEVKNLGDNKAIAGLHTFLLRDRSGVFINGFRGYIHFNRVVKVQLDRLATGLKVYGVSKGNLKTIKFPVPTPVEQTAIATALFDTDALITSLEKLITKKRNIKQGAMQKLLRPKEGWEVKSYGEIFDFLTTATFSRAEMSEGEEIECVHYGDIHIRWNCFLDFEKHSLPAVRKEKGARYPLVKEGDIIMADASEDYSGVGESVEVMNLGSRKAIAGLHTFLLRDRKGTFLNGFRGYIHKSRVVKDQIEKLASGLKVYGISKNNLKTILIPVPSPLEQKEIAALLSDMDAEIASLETKLAKYKWLKMGMMQNLLTGKIRLI